MKVLGRWSVASVMKTVIDVAYYLLVVIVPLACLVALWVAWSGNSASRRDSFQLRIPVRFQLDPAGHPFSAVHPDVRRVVLETARKIQFDLVPGEAFRRNDVVIQARMRPARSVGGDLYDVIDLDDRRLAVVLGDVTGKGLPAALLMTSVVGSLRALLSAGLRGRELIAALNRHVCANSPAGRFVTLFYGELDAFTGTLTYVNAGHNPPLLRRAGGDVDELQPTAMLLGVDADAPVEARQVEMQPADRLLLFTDGLSEALNRKDEEYGEVRVRDSLLRAHALPPPAALERLVAEVESFCGTAPPHDDMTLMLIARQPASAGGVPRSESAMK